MTDKYIRINPELKKQLKIVSAQKDTSIKALAEIYIRQGLKKEEVKEMLNFSKSDFFDKDGWIKFNGFKVAVGEKGEVEYCDPLKNQQYYEQNSYYTVVEIRQDENDIQNDTNRLKEIIREKLKH